MNHSVYGSGNGYVAGMLVLLFLIMIFFFCGLILILANTGRPRIWGFYMIVTSILLSVVALMIYSSTRTDLW